MQSQTLQKNIKDSGVGWIGEIPNDWNVFPGSHLFKVSKDKVKADALQPISVGYMGVVPQLENAAKNVAGGDRKHILPGDIVINSRSDRMGAGGLSTYEGGVSLIYHVLRPNNEILSGKYFHYIFRNKMFSQEFYKHGNGIVADLWTTKDYELKKIYYPAPLKEVQEKIVSFLDTKTSNIDSLIEKKKQMIELLKEKRSSIITHAVTKGLDPEAKMKDSGVDWIGEIPEGWSVKKHKFIFDSIFKKEKNKHQISLENIESWTGKYLPTDSDYSGDGVAFNENDILFGKLRPYLAKAFLADKPGEALGDLLVYRSMEEIDPSYGHKMFLSKNLIDFIDASTYGTKMPRVSPDFIRSLEMIYPPVPVQGLIVQYIDKKVNQIDGTISKIKKQIKLLKEYKSSLIYHAVTGKLEI